MLTNGQLRPVLLAIIMVFLAFVLGMVAPVDRYDARADYCEDHPEDCGAQ